MNHLRKQLNRTLAHLIQVVGWGDLMDRTFRPVITPNPIRVRVSDGHWTNSRP